ncbi:MarR family transcriptional regulator [Pseudomonas oryzihabitans]|uniref:MarR family winged helix-turn-helix transcriptional regulator n=1 Tax=Pseudomonas oryzihabitans TaxID=47885 RepID=UPI002895895D|nr:MarR family transcriptional regulator [Pseudomonas oryzihabitans]MDT3722450.1 MarR family transcriptional regulator [Pseudomonas oryzihabitans]
MPKQTSRTHRFDPVSEDFHKEDFPFYWLARVHARYTLEMERRLKAIELDVPRWRMLNILQENEVASISELAEFAIAKMSTVTKIIYRMKEAGLVDTYPNPQDGRVTLVTLTERGHQAFFGMHEVTQDLFQKSFRGLTEPQLRKLNLVLSKVFDNLV